MSIYVSGSLAFDRIMNFHGNFQDHVLMDKLHMLNISFMVDDMIERRGGCAGNIAYTLALLGEKPIILGCGGRDFDSYAEHLQEVGLSVEGIRRDPELFTALCYITTDLSGNQITGFYPGAMTKPCDYTFANPGKKDLAIVSPGNMEDMQSLPKLYREHNVRYIFDPGQQLPIFTKDMLNTAIDGAFAYVCNDYELGMTAKLLELEREDDLLNQVEWLITTLGAQGCRVRGRDGTDKIIAPVPCEHVADPTGAGDSHRSGLLFGLSHGLSVVESAKFGSVTASYCIACQGTQEHHFTKEDFVQRYKSVFGEMPISL